MKNLYKFIYELLPNSAKKKNKHATYLLMQHLQRVAKLKGNFYGIPLNDKRPRAKW